MIECQDFITNDYLALVWCQTYNHVGYIQEALNGFAIQKTKFPFVCVIIDDYSTDGTQGVIKDWMTAECDMGKIKQVDLELSTLFVVQHKDNKNCTFAFYLLKQNLYKESEKKEKLIEPWVLHVKYQAICEGDDYWTYPNKLQEQVFFLENHREYSAVSSNASVLTSPTAPKRLFGSCMKRDYYRLKEIIPRRKFHTASVVFRIASMRESPYYKEGNWDTFMWCCLLTQGPIHYDGTVTCVYRKQHQGITESTPRIGWLKLISKWADTLTECFVPQYVQKKYVVRSVTRDIIRVYFAYKERLSFEDKETIRGLYRHNFSLWNVFFDMKEMIIISAKKVLRKDH